MNYSNYITNKIFLDQAGRKKKLSACVNSFFKDKRIFFFSHRVIVYISYLKTDMDVSEVLIFVSIEFFFYRQDEQQYLQVD